mmetsp:Transcript_13147/g.31879  ORF Transcript_13147/g.31879 Transcript_13147/m.31879 type:complete len:360 (-) Transcript_13147:392-1471(-)
MGVLTASADAGATSSYLPDALSAALSPGILAVLLFALLPAAVVLTALGIYGSRDSRTNARDKRTPRVILVTGASGGLGKLLVNALRAAFPAAVVYGTSRTGWKPPAISDPSARVAVEAGDCPLGMDDPSTEEQPLLALDVTDEQSVAACVLAIFARHGAIDVLVNNAGTVSATWAKATAAADAESQMATNFFGMVRMVRACVPCMTGECRRIINIGSIGGRIGLPYQSMYSASKAAVMVWTDALRMEVWGQGVKVSLVEPGDLKPGVNAIKSAGFDDDPVASGAFAIMRAEEVDGTDPAAVCRAVVAALRAEMPAGRYLVGPDAWLVEALCRLCPHALKEYFLASHYRVPPRHKAWIRV